MKWQLFNFSESRISTNIYRMFRIVDWTHDMIIVKWHLFIWHERKFCALTNAPPVQSTQTGQWLSTLFHANCSAAQVMFRSVDWTHDMIIVKWREVTLIQFFRKPNLSKNSPNVPKCGLNTRHDNREVTWSDSYSIFRKPNLSEYLLSVPKCSEVWIEHTTW